MVWVQIRADVLSGLIWVRTVFKGYQHQDLHRFEKCLNLKGFLEKSLKTKLCLKKSWKIIQMP